MIFSQKEGDCIKKQNPFFLSSMYVMYVRYVTQNKCINLIYSETGTPDYKLLSLCLTCFPLIPHIYLAQSLKRSSTVSGWFFSPFVSCNIINVGIKNACNMSSSPCTQPDSLAYSSTRMLPKYRKQLCWCLW
jgi:hypothetical protein